jgi:microcystin degradation protein MlrC
MRCYVAGVQHECSSFSPIPTSLRSFTTVRWGSSPRGATMGLGYGESCEAVTALGFELVAGPFSAAQPSLPAPDHVWRHIRDGILDDLRAAGDVDIVWLCLHGAQMSDRQDDCEGELLELAREIVGDGVAIGTLLDLHANVSPRMLAAADLVVSCREYPHVDYGERALEMLPVLAAIRRGDVAPTTAAVRFMGPGAYPTPDEPMASFVRRFTDAESADGVLMVSVNHGFEGSDQPDLSASVVVTTDGDADRAALLANEVAADFRAVIMGGTWVGPGVAESVDEAFAFDGGPVVLADRADNAGGGAAGDSTFVLAELIRRDARDVAVALLWDPQAVQFCHDAGEGAVLPLRIGGKCGPMSGPPLDVLAEVTSVRSESSQALFGKGEPNFPLGLTAAIKVGGVEVVLASVRTQVFSRHVFTDHGIDPMQRRVLVVKSTQHFANDFGKFAAHIVRCDGPGTLTADLASLPYTRIRRPMLGLDDVTTVDLEAMPAVPIRRR